MWQQKSIERVKDIINVTENRLLSFNELQNKIICNKANILFEYNALLNALPCNWKQWILIATEKQHVSNILEIYSLNTKPTHIKRLIESKTHKNNSHTRRACDIFGYKNLIYESTSHFGFWQETQLKKSHVDRITMENSSQHLSNQHSAEQNES